MYLKKRKKNKEAKILNERKDICVFWSDNGWMNTSLTEKWISRAFPTKDNGKKLLIWDSFKCHVAEEVKKLLHDKNVMSAIVPGGCTGQVQTLDVCINQPFKSRMEELFDEFMCNDSMHTYTKGGNLRAPSKTQLCDMIVKAWETISPDMVVKSFKVCGQAPNILVSNILTLKDGKACEEGRQKLENLWKFNVNSINLMLLEPKEQDDVANVDLVESIEEDDYCELPDPEDPLDI